MELTLNQALQDADLDVLRETTPFRDAPESLLCRVAAIARRARYAEGERVYGASGEADDIFVVVSGRVKHVFTPEVGAREPIKRITCDGVFGWAGLLSNLYAPFALDALRVFSARGDEPLSGALGNTLGNNAVGRP